MAQLQNQRALQYYSVLCSTAASFSMIWNRLLYVCSLVVLWLCSSFFWLKVRAVLDHAKRYARSDVPTPEAKHMQTNCGASCLRLRECSAAPLPARSLCSSDLLEFENEPRGLNRMAVSSGTLHILIEAGRHGMRCTTRRPGVCACPMTCLGRARLGGQWRKTRWRGPFWGRYALHAQRPQNDPRHGAHTHALSAAAAWKSAASALNATLGGRRGPVVPL